MADIKPGTRKKVPLVKKAALSSDATNKSVKGPEVKTGGGDRKKVPAKKEDTGLKKERGKRDEGVKQEIGGTLPEARSASGAKGQTDKGNNTLEAKTTTSKGKPKSIYTGDRVEEKKNVFRPSEKGKLPAIIEEGSSAEEGKPSQMPQMMSPSKPSANAPKQIKATKKVSSQSKSKVKGSGSVNSNKKHSKEKSLSTIKLTRTKSEELDISKLRAPPHIMSMFAKDLKKAQWKAQKKEFLSKEELKKEKEEWKEMVIRSKLLQPREKPDGDWEDFKEAKERKPKSEEVKWTTVPTAAVENEIRGVWKTIAEKTKLKHGQLVMVQGDPDAETLRVFRVEDKRKMGKGARFKQQYRRVLLDLDSESDGDVDLDWEDIPPDEKTKVKLPPRGVQSGSTRVSDKNVKNSKAEGISKETSKESAMKVVKRKKILRKVERNKY